jgi:hypothetical protein
MSIGSGLDREKSAPDEQQKLIAITDYFALFPGPFWRTIERAPFRQVSRALPAHTRAPVDRFRPASGFPKLRERCLGVNDAVADFAGVVAVFLGNGTGNFAAATNLAIGDRLLSMTVGDFNLDGNLDLAAVRQMDNKVSILPGDGTGGFGTWNRENINWARVV